MKKTTIYRRPMDENLFEEELTIGALFGMIPVICEKGHRNHPLTDGQKQNNRQKSKIRCRMEHIFGFIEGAKNGSFVRSIGIVRAKAATALTCLVYNIFRYVQINKYQPQLIASMG